MATTDWTKSNTNKTSVVPGVPNRAEGAEGDIQLRQTKSGPKLFGKLGGQWLSTFLFSEANRFTIRDRHTGIEKVGIDSAGNANFHGTLKITGFGGMLDFQGGNDNIILGNALYRPLNALQNASVNNDNIALGNYSIFSAVQASDNVSIGNECMKNIGRSSNEAVDVTSGNVAIGKAALKGYEQGTRTLGYNNVAIGFGAMSEADKNDGSLWGAGGSYAAYKNFQNICIGKDAGKYLSASNNIFIGVNAGVGSSAVSGGTFGSGGVGGNISYQNIGIGTNVLTSITTGNDNVCVGYQAGDSITTGLRNISIGAGSDVSSAGATNQIVIGFNASGQANNTAVIGSALITDVYMASDSEAIVRAGGMAIKEVGSAPSDIADHGQLFTKSDNKLYFIDGAGTEYTVDLTAT